MIHPASISGGAPVAIATRKRPNTQNISHVPLIVKYTMLSTAIGSRRSPDYGSERTAGVEDVPNSFQACPSNVGILATGLTLGIVCGALGHSMRIVVANAAVLAVVLSSISMKLIFDAPTSKWRLKIFRGILTSLERRRKGDS